jgi:hypothetical protein
MLRTAAAGLAGTAILPTSVRAVLGYYAETAVFDYRSLRLKTEVDETTEEMVTEAFAAVETALAEEFEVERVDFAYDTKLILPAQLTLAYCYRQARTARADALAKDPPTTAGDYLQAMDVEERAEWITRLAVEALIDGDMRDALNDDEFEDFEVELHTEREAEGGGAGKVDRRRVAEVAQATLNDRVEAAIADLPDGGERVRHIYDEAVDFSEAHQDRDPHFRELMERAEAGDEKAVAAIEAEYRDAAFEDPPDLFDERDLEIPYFRTQYARVGVLYAAMIDIYRAAGFAIPDGFKKSIVLAIIGAQIWLDDVDDYEVDLREGQLTPVTAEYLRHDADHAAYAAVLEVTREYLDLACEYATEADSPLTGIASEYIYRSGDPTVLPGSPE